MFCSLQDLSLWPTRDIRRKKRINDAVTDGRVFTSAAHPPASVTIFSSVTDTCMHTQTESRIEAAHCLTIMHTQFPKYQNKYKIIWHFSNFTYHNQHITQSINIQQEYCTVVTIHKKPPKTNRINIWFLFPSFSIGHKKRSWEGGI